MTDPHVPGGVRLQKVLAGAGLGSRRACEEIIAAGRVTVDGEVVRELGLRVDPTAAVIHVDGLRVQLDDSLVTLALNKPVGVVSTMDDDRGRPSLAQYVADRPERLFHVGRLDADTSGLILLTNDGELANRLTHPRYGVEKTYRVKVVKPPVKPDALERLRSGVELDDGMTAPAKVRRVKADTIEITIREGRNRQVRRMIEAVGGNVTRLVRTRIGPLRLDDLEPGEWRELTPREVDQLREAGA